MPSRVQRLPRLTVAIAATAALALTAPAAGLASTQAAHPGPTAHIALGFMGSGAHHAPRHHAAAHHRRTSSR